MQVEKLMCRDVKTVNMTDSLADAARIMWECDCGCVPVVNEEGRVSGIITDRDACMAAYLSGKPLRDLPVEGSMARQVMSCRPEDDILDAENVMRRAQLRRLPVTDANGRLLGMLSINDIARHAERMQNERTPGVNLRDVAMTLVAVSRPRSNSYSTSPMPT